MSQNYEWESGTKFGRLMSTGKSYNDERSRRFVEFICSCGKIIWRRFDGVKNAPNASCGCFNAERIKANPPHTTHGLNSHPLWDVYRAIIDRCTRPSCNRYKNYGAKGVIICPEWKGNYPAFYEWAINNGWKEGLQLDKDIKYKEKHGTNTGMIYSPEYCSFITSKENNRNRTTSVFAEYNGQRKTLAEWAEEYGVSQQTLGKRINEYGYSIEKALTTPIKNKKRVI